MLVALTLLAGVLAHGSDEVSHLPGYGVPKQRTLAGYVEVNPDKNGHLYYMFFEKSGSGIRSDTPLIIWLNGGPGASSALGNFLEHGPYRLQPSGNLTENQFAWNTLAHVMYFDQPVGTGYSYCDKDGYVTNMKELSKQFSVGLLRFYEHHPEYKANPLIMAGESYAGVYVPAITAHILTEVPALKVAGVLIGNPGNFHYTQYKGQIDFAQSHGLIGDAQAVEAQKLWEDCEQLVNQKKMVLAFQKCEEMSTYIFNMAGNPFLYNVAQWGDVYDDVLAPVMQKYFSDPKGKSDIHAGSHDWKNGDGTSAPNPVVIALNKTLMDSVLPDLEVILHHGVPLTVYNGVLDGSSCNHVSVFQALKLLRWTHKDSFFKAPRQQWKVPGEKHPAGYVQRGGGLSFVWIANSGHLVPLDQPVAALTMLHNFFHDITAASQTRYTDVYM
eukprot:TRINITY_DN37685_c0_g1_i1.p1 TRINITY_DN37685_c0_g1~~TRINITY_DN37685_c0_g1_i1.p1  ORF type:complete len:441 (+),score=45.58 TRINITY_DN37685_c0_g1_i1:70-1392(+)